MLIDDFLTDGLDKSADYQYTNYANRYIIIENIKGLLSSAENEIIVKVKGGELSVKGETLVIKELGKSIICISGKIVSVSGY